MKKTLFASLFLTSSLFAQDVQLYQFENPLTDNIKATNPQSIQLSQEKYKDGKQSLAWTFQPNETLTIKGNVSYKTFQKGQQEKARSSFMMWIYNENPIDDEMQIQFKKEGELKSHFPLKMNFKGWRTMWVQYDRDMQGTPSEEMNEIVFVAPNKAGKVYIDHLIPSVLIDPRHNARDEQVPFVNLNADNAANAHWMALYKNYHQINKDLPSVTLTENILKDIQTIEERYKERLLKTVKVNKKLIKEKEDKFKEIEKIALEFNQKLVIYKQVDEEQFKLYQHMVTRDFGQFIREIAYMYHSTDKNELKLRLATLFNQALDYMYDQGWTKGSSQGTIHHLGYQVREIYEAIYLMKEPLIELGAVEKAKEMVTWFSAMGMIYTPDENFRVNVDVLNTMLPGMLTAILLNQDKQQEAKELILLQKYLINSIKPSKGVLGGFKYDGTVFHHMQNYPAYAEGAFKGLLPIIYYLHGTDFGIKGESFNIVKKAILFTRLYANKYNYLLSLTGRHPNDKFNIDTESFRLLALSGEKGIDKDLAEAYLRLSPNGKSAEDFKALGFKAETAPQGAWTANMGSLQLHRRGEWLVGMKGYSRYLVGNETYIKNNLYGRYMSYGTFQILESNLKESGFLQEGWDWKHFPGTTAINVPFEQLKSSISQVDTASGVEEMLLSDETYSGGNHLNGNSMFAMKLHEHPKYNGSHRARKSVFIFDNRAVLLGTGIENNDQQNETHTTLFQNYLPEGKESFIQNENMILDSQQNLYKVEEGDVVIQKGLQHSFDQNTGKPTQNNYELAYINHSKSPTNGRYHYAVLIKGSDKEQQDFKNNSQYQVIAQNNQQHIVKDLVSNILGFALFESGNVAENDYIEAVDTPSMVMLTPTEKGLKLNFVDPDLRLYEGLDPEQYKAGKMIERSIYSRPWIGNKGEEYTTTLILKGHFKVENHPNVQTEIEGDKTKVMITTHLGKVVEMTLIKQ